MHKPCVIKMLNNLRISPADIRFVFASFTPSLIELLYPFSVCVCVVFQTTEALMPFFSILMNVFVISLAILSKCLTWYLPVSCVNMRFYVKVSSLKYRIVFLYDSSDFKIKIVDNVSFKYLA